MTHPPGESRRPKRQPTPLARQETSVDITQEVFRYLTDGVTVDLVGRTGSGRTEVLTRVAEALASEQRPVIRFQGIHAQRNRTLGAVVLGAPNMAPSTYGSVREFSGALERELRPGTVVLVDDADDVDPTMIGVLAALHATTQAALLVARRLPLEPRGDVKALVTSLQPGVRIAMPPLRFDEVHQLVHSLLGDHVEPLTVARIATKSGGLPGLVRAIVGIGRRTGAVVQVDGVWRATRSLWAPELSHTIGALLAHTRQRDVESLADLAASGVVDLSRAVEIVGGKRLAALQRVGLVEVLSTSGGGQLSLFPPLLGEYFTQEYTSPRDLVAGDLYTLATDAPAAGETPRKASPAGDPIMSRVLAEHWAHQTTVRQMRWETEPTPARAVPLLTAMLSAGATREAVDGVFFGTRRDVDSTVEHRAELSGWYAVYLAVVCGEADEAFRLLEATRAELPSMGAYTGAVEVHLRFLLDRLPHEPDTARTWADGEGLDTDAHNGVQIELALARGEALEALRLLESYAPTGLTFQRHRDVCWGLALVLAGRLDAGIEWALAHLASAQRMRDPGGIAAHSYVAGLGLTTAGRFGELDDVLAAAMTLTTVSVLREHFHAGTFAIAALGAVWQGRREYAAMLASEARTLWHRSGPYPAMAAGEVLTTTGVLDSASAIWESVDDRFARGYVASGIVAAVEAAERARSGAALRVPRTWAYAVDSPLLVACVRYVEAVAEQDRQGVEQAVASFESLGAQLYVVRARVSQALLMREEGEMTLAVGELDRAWEIAAGFGASVEGLFAAYVRAVDISARESEVLALLSTGLNTADIATALTVSVRTVENHLSNVYRKVGVDSRVELRRVCGTWLGSASRKVA
ncbi:LuxR C-terminal-related transcriptional regulator [Cellulosimicrobium cellulans]|uniref:helix-turn-helix transcriptional regulator n=1 Tax=Cellulosimicrobium cellulans TaxID=1710 RepID=UPI0036571612